MKTFTIRMGRDKFKFRVIPERKTVYGTVESKIEQKGPFGGIDFATGHDMSLFYQGPPEMVWGKKIEATVTCAEGDTWDPIVGLGVCFLKLVVKKYTKKNWYRFKELMKA